MSKQVYEEKKVYVEGTMADLLAVYPRFEGIDYAVDKQTSEEFIRIRDEVSGPMFINVTGNSLSAIAQEVSRVILRIKPTGLVVNASVKNSIAPLFRRTAEEVANV